MLTENDVVTAVAKWLKRNGYISLKQLTTLDRGIDIVATHRESRRRLLVEAKGQTSSKEGTSRFGKPFNRGQVGVHVAKAFYCVASLRQQFSTELAEVAMAFPDDPLHRSVLDAISESLVELNITVFLVAADLSVSKLQ